ncbi:MAG: FMN-binding negative transcriptional regulator [Terracoccus sp.]
MYLPRFNVMPEPEVGAFLQAHPVAQLVTVGADGVPDATLLPILIDSGGGVDRVVAHMARANEHWRRIVDGSPALFVVAGPDAYVSPSWYASKAEHGRVVPTWNYSAVHLSGPVTIHDDVDWVRAAVTRLTERHEGERAAPWSVSDAPEKYVTGQLRAVVGIEMTIEKLEAKAKLSQNRSDADRLGVIVGLREEPDPSDAWRAATAATMAAAMEEALEP